MLRSTCGAIKICFFTFLILLSNSQFCQTCSKWSVEHWDVSGKFL